MPRERADAADDAPRERAEVEWKRPLARARLFLCVAAPDEAAADAFPRVEDLTPPLPPRALLDEDANAVPSDEDASALSSDEDASALSSDALPS